ncbi:UDP-glucose 4-epimerase GalE [Brevundimonas sp.]|uniref:UDP-glucose 4-epimerase GalE n=1 Tax=Brevundimonas sp. TaxID=1871086 RepID=UPI003D6C9013
MSLTSDKTPAVLVTGGAGYIGSHVCEALALAGYRPVTLDNLSTGHAEFVRWGALVQADVADAEVVRRTLVEHDVVAVMHFAASSVVSESAAEPLSYYRNNVGGLLGLLDGMRAAGVNKLVFSSTCAIYGDPKGAVIREDLTPAPISPYGRSKLMCETVLRDAVEAHGLKTVALRYFNACGASAEADIGEFRPVETHLIPRAMMAALGEIDDFQVCGADYDTPDGTAVRDYIHVADLAAGHLAALEQLLDGREGFAAFNLGTGEGRSVREVLDAVAAVSGTPAPDAVGPRRAGDPPVLVADPSLARRELGFATRHSDLASVVGSAWAWHSRHHARGNVLLA